MKPVPANKRSLLIGLVIVLPIICIAGIVFFFARMYQRDMQSLADFMASYQAYDVAVKAASSGTDGRLADMALSDLKAKSSLRISSLIKNEKEAMRVMREIADLSEKEISALEAYRQATGLDAARSRLAQTFQGLTKERQDAFAHFQDLGR